MKASLKRSQQCPDVAPPPQRNRTATSTPLEIPTPAPATTTIVGGPTANTAETRDSPSTLAINATRHIPTHVEILNDTDLFKSYLDKIDRDLAKIPQKQPLTSKIIHT
nr:hypothetical protein CFP56_44909 [Quercus suber]